MRLVLVMWQDAVGVSRRDGWTSKEQMSLTTPLAECQSVGWVLAEDDERILLVRDRRDNAEREMDVDSEIAIPKAWANKIIDLVPSKGRRRTK